MIGAARGVGLELEVRLAGLALAGATFVELALLSGLEDVPSLVPGRLLRLIADAGRRGGPMGLSGGLKKLSRNN